MIIELGIAACAGASVGYFACAIFTAGKIAEANEAWDEWELAAVHVTDELHDERVAHTRCADSRNVLLSRIEAIRELLNRPRTIRKGELASILDGEVA